MSVIAGGNFNMNDLYADAVAIANATLALKQAVTLMSTKLAQVNPQDIADMNPTYPELGADPQAQTTNRVARAQLIKSAIAEAKVGTDALSPIALTSIASGRPLHS